MSRTQSMKKKKMSGYRIKTLEEFGERPGRWNWGGEMDYLYGRELTQEEYDSGSVGKWLIKVELDTVLIQPQKQKMEQAVPQFKLCHLDGIGNHFQLHLREDAQPGMVQKLEEIAGVHHVHSDSWCTAVSYRKMFTEDEIRAEIVKVVKQFI